MKFDWGFIFCRSRRGLRTGEIKTGASCCSEHLARYNQLLRIEEELEGKAVYAGKNSRCPNWTELWNLFWAGGILCVYRLRLHFTGSNLISLTTVFSFGLPLCCGTRPWPPAVTSLMGLLMCSEHILRPSVSALGPRMCSEHKLRPIGDVAGGSYGCVPEHGGRPPVCVKLDFMLKYTDSMLSMITIEFFEPDLLRWLSLGILDFVVQRGPCSFWARGCLGSSIHECIVVVS